MNREMKSYYHIPNSLDAQISVTQLFIGLASENGREKLPSSLRLSTSVTEASS